MVLDATLLNTQHYKVRIKGKVKQSKERSKHPPLYLGVVAIEKGASGSPSTMVANNFFIYLGSNFSSTESDVSFCMDEERTVIDRLSTI